MHKYYLIIIFLSFGVVVAIYYTITQIGSPFEAHALKLDEQRRNSITSLGYSIDRYYQSNNKLPTKLSDLQNELPKNLIDPETHKEYNYTPEFGRKYKICSTFAYSSDEYRSSLFLNNMKHPKGNYCFEFMAKSNYPLFTPQPLPKSTPLSYSSNKDVACRTLGGRMFDQGGGRWKIGCDVMVMGNFDLSRSYCESISTLVKQPLRLDILKRPNWYYATLEDLDRGEEVRVYVYTLTGEKVDCLPHLNEAVG